MHPLMQQILDLSRFVPLCQNLNCPPRLAPAMEVQDGAPIHVHGAECQGMTPPLHLSLLHLCSHLPTSALLSSLAPHASSILNLCRGMLLHRQPFELLAPPDTPGWI